MDILALMGRSCDDLTVKNGIIRQMSNRRSTIFEIDCSEILGENNVMLSATNMKEKLLIPFRKQSVDMTLGIDDDGFVFHDDCSKLRFKKPVPGYISNKFMKQEELDARIDMANNAHVIGGKLEKHILDRVCAWTDTLSATQIRVDFSDDKAIFSVRPSDSANTTLGTLLILDGLEEELDGFCGYDAEPFQINVDKFDVEFYKQQSGNVLMKMTSFMDSEEKVPITIWGASAMKENG